MVLDVTLKVFLAQLIHFDGGQALDVNFEAVFRDEEPGVQKRARLKELENKLVALERRVHAHRSLSYDVHGFDKVSLLADHLISLVSFELEIVN